MGHQLRKFAVNEAEGGAPEASTYGQDVRESHFTGFPTMLHITRSGVHPSSPFYAGVFGHFPRGGKAPVPVVPYSMRYTGELPIAQQPTLRKPYPWE